MSMRPIDVQSRSKVFRQAPRYVTFSGYLLGLLILLGAASTWFIPTRISVQVPAVLRAHAENLTYSENVLVLGRPANIGSEVKAGDLILEYTSDVKQVAQAGLTRQLESSLKLIRNHDDVESELLSAKLRESLALLTTSGTVQKAVAPIGGWLLGDNASTSSPTIVAAGIPVLTIGTLSTLTLELVTATDSFPGVKVGDQVAVLLSEWDTKDVYFRLDESISKTSFEFPRRDFTDGQLEALASGNAIAVLINQTALKGTATVGASSVILNVEFAGTTPAFQSNVKSRKSMQLELPDFDRKVLDSTWGSVSTKMKLSLSEKGISPALREALVARLHDGHGDLQVSSCWVQTDTRKLFWRLFGK